MVYINQAGHEMKIDHDRYGSAIPPMKQTVFSQIDDLAKQVSDTARRAGDLADRFFGPIPEACSATGPASEPSGLFAETRENIERMRRNISRVNEYLGLIEDALP